MIRRNFDIAYLVLTCLMTACHSAPERTCTRSSDCPSEMFCRISECVPAVGTDHPLSGDAGPDDAADVQNSDASARDGSGADGHADARDVPLRCKNARPPAPGDLVINELMIDPPSGPEGDTNGDGLRDAFDDEFVEIVDVSNTPIYLEHIALQVGGETVFQFPPSCLPPGGTAVVWGGFTGDGGPSTPPGSVAYVASSRLGLTNGGGWLQLKSAAGEVVDEAKWSGSPEQSLTLAPQIDGATLEPHTTINDDRLHSPGLCADGSPTKGGCPDS